MNGSRPVAMELISEAGRMLPGMGNLVVGSNSETGVCVPGTKVDEKSPPRCAAVGTMPKDE